jgi:hypothetical protein
VLEVPLDGGGGMVVTCPLGGGGGSDDHTTNSVSGGGPGRLPLHSSLVLGFWWVGLVGRSRSIPSACTPVMLVGSRASV